MSEHGKDEKDIGSEALDKLMRPVWLGSGNVVNENKRAKGNGWKRNLLYVLAALLFLVLGYGFYCIIPYLGIALEWVLQHI